MTVPKRTFQLKGKINFSSVGDSWRLLYRDTHSVLFSADERRNCSRLDQAIVKARSPEPPIALHYFFLVHAGACPEIKFKEGFVATNFDFGVLLQNFNFCGYT